MEIFLFVLILCSAYLQKSVESAHGYQYDPPPSRDTIMDVTQFGAVGDAKTDDSIAFQSAWQEACQNISDMAKITVPSGMAFLVSQTQFEGPCKCPNITFEILGVIVAPPKSAWVKKKAEEWLCFSKVDGLTVVGNGQGWIDGRGDSWWAEAHGNDNARPTALRFSSGNNLEVSGLRHTNSQKNHISIYQCNNARISGLQITAPSDSPNTDGIDIALSTNLNINNLTIATGDDCIAINGGTSNVTISEIACGPGHGISIGSLGKDGSDEVETVEGININNCSFNGTQNGVRIKTWQGGSGFARNINFTQITFIASNNPVIIDQFYCPHKTCKTKTSAVKVSDIFYSGLRGTSITGKNATVSLMCSETVPCTNIMMSDVDIVSVDPSNFTTAECKNAHGLAQNCVHPPIDCLMP